MQSASSVSANNADGGSVPLGTSCYLCLQVMSMDEAYTLDPKVALHIRALSNYTDEFGMKR